TRRALWRSEYRKARACFFSTALIAAWLLRVTNKAASRSTKNSLRLLSAVDSRTHKTAKSQSLATSRSLKYEGEQTILSPWDSAVSAMALAESSQTKKLPYRVPIRATSATHCRDTTEARPQNERSQVRRPVQTVHQRERLCRSHSSLVRRYS